jgi:hypothetical protein
MNASAKEQMETWLYKGSKGSEWCSYVSSQNCHEFAVVSKKLELQLSNSARFAHPQDRNPRTTQVFPSSTFRTISCCVTEMQHQQPSKNGWTTDTMITLYHVWIFVQYTNRTESIIQSLTSAPMVCDEIAAPTCAFTSRHCSSRV